MEGFVSTKYREDLNLGGAIVATLTSPNEMDSNLETANVVDGLFAIARALQKIAHELKRTNDEMFEDDPPLKAI